MRLGAGCFEHFGRADSHSALRGHASPGGINFALLAARSECSVSTGMRCEQDGVCQMKHQGFWQLPMMGSVSWQELYLSPRLRGKAQDADAAKIGHKHFTLRCL